MKKCYYCNDQLSKGALHGLHQDCFIQCFSLPKINTFENLDPKKSGSSSNNDLINKDKNSFYHGKYLKYTAHLSGIAYILKIQESKLPDLPAMEYLCNKIASILSLKIPQYYLIDFNNRPTFVTRNFMQNSSSVLHHMYKFIPDGKTSYNCSRVIKVIMEQTNKPLDVCRFVEICLFDSLIGNNDRHGRNLGIIDSGVERSLAPMYDNPSYFGIADKDILNAHFNISGCIRTSTKKNPALLDYLEEFAKIGHKKICDLFVKKTVDRFDLIIDSIKTSHLGRERKKYFMIYLEKKLSEMENEYK